MNERTNWSCSFFLLSHSTWTINHVNATAHLSYDNSQQLNYEKRRKDRKKKEEEEEEEEEGEVIKSFNWLNERTNAIAQLPIVKKPFPFFLSANFSATKQRVNEEIKKIKS